MDPSQTLPSLALLLAVLSGYNATEPPSDQSGTVCTLDSLPALPDVRLGAVTHEDKPAPHCKVTGVIGTETNFELLLPDDWNGKFAMGGGGPSRARDATSDP